MLLRIVFPSISPSMKKRTEAKARAKAVKDAAAAAAAPPSLATAEVDGAAGTDLSGGQVSTGRGAGAGPAVKPCRSAGVPGDVRGQKEAGIDMNEAMAGGRSPPPAPAPDEVAESPSSRAPSSWASPSQPASSVSSASQGTGVNTSTSNTVPLRDESNLSESSPLIQFGDVVPDDARDRSRGRAGEGKMSNDNSRAPSVTPLSDDTLQNDVPTKVAQTPPTVQETRVEQAESVGGEPNAGGGAADSTATLGSSAPTKKVVDEPKPPCTIPVVKAGTQVSETVDGGGSNAPTPLKQRQAADKKVAVGEGSHSSPRNRAGGTRSGPSLMSGSHKSDNDTRSRSSPSSPSNGIDQAQSDEHSPAAQGLLSSPSLAGSIPVEYAQPSWKPLPMGMASTVFGGGDIKGTGEASPVLSNGTTGRHADGGNSQVRVNAYVGPSARDVDIPPPIKANHAQWASARRGRGYLATGSHGQHGNFGPSSAPAAPGPTGWSSASSLNTLQAEGLVGMMGANGGGNSVGGRLRSAPEAFAVGVGTNQVVPLAGYGSLTARAAPMARIGSAGHDGSPAGGPRRNGGDLEQAAGPSTSLVTSVGGGVTGNPFGGFVLGYQSPGTRQQQSLMPGGSAWGGGGGGFSRVGRGSPGVAAAAMPGSLSPASVHQVVQPQQALSPPPPPPPPQQQQQHPFHGSVVGSVVPGTTALMASSTQQRTVTSTTWPASQQLASATTGATVANPPMVEVGNNTSLAAEAPPFIPAGAMGAGSPAMWGMTGPQPQPQQVAGLLPAPAVPHPMVLAPTMGQGVPFGTGAVPMSLGLRTGHMTGAGTVPGTAPGTLPVSVPVSGPGPTAVSGMLGRPQHPQPAMFASPQVQQQQQQQVRDTTILWVEHGVGMCGRLSTSSFFRRRT